MKSRRCAALTRILGYGLVLSFSACDASDTPHVAELWWMNGPTLQLQRPFGAAEAPPGGIGYREHARELAKRSELKGVLLRFGAWDAPIAAASALDAGTARLSAVGKTVHCHLLNASMSSYLAAVEHCERLSMAPSAYVDTRGLSMTQLRFRGLLDQLGIRPELVQSGKLKGAADPINAADFDPALSARLKAVLESASHDWMKRVSRARKLDIKKLEGWLAEAPFDAERAKALKLVDAVETLDEARNSLLTATGVAALRSPAKASDGGLSLSDVLALLDDDQDTESDGDAYVALTPLTGMIQSDFAAERWLENLRKLEEDEACTGVVLLIDSPGGAADLSERIFRRVLALRQRKPVIAYIFTMGASGGYYAAAAATQIVASPSAWIGSIGVVGGKVDLSPLMARYGVAAQSIRTGAHAGIFDLTAPYSASDLDRMRTLITKTHTRFKAHVAEGRGLKQEAVERVGDGRILTAEQAKEAQLIDRIGSLDVAVRALAELLELGEIEALRLTPAPEPWFARLASGLSYAPAGASLESEAETFLGTLKAARRALQPVALWTPASLSLWLQQP